MKYILIGLMVFIGCNSSKQDAASNIEYEVLIQEYTGGKTTKELSVIDNSKDLLYLYNTINNSREPGFEIPKIDFSTQRILCLFMGEYTSGGFAISIDHIKSTQEAVVVYYRETKPKPDDMVTMSLTQPFCIAQINSTNKPIKFEQID